MFLLMVLLFFSRLQIEQNIFCWNAFSNLKVEFIIDDHTKKVTKLKIDVTNAGLPICVGTDYLLFWEQSTFRKFCKLGKFIPKKVDLPLIVRINIQQPHLESFFLTIVTVSSKITLLVRKSRYLHL